ncbi:MAG: Calx-beta domain-containing protein, partial [Pyrinomonadaceae bacterium]
MNKVYMRHPWKLPLAVVCLLTQAFLPLLPAPRGSAQAVTYTAVDLGTLGGAQSTALGIDECGKVVGESMPAGSTSFHPYVWDGTTMTDLGTFGGMSGGASAVNTVGRVAGYAQTPTSEQRPFNWTQAGGKADLGTPGTGAAAYDLNDANQIVGQWEISPLQDRAFVWTQATGMKLVTAPWGTPISAYGINNAGNIVGTAQTSGGASHAFISAGGVVTDLGTLGGTNSFAYDLNESDVVVGHANIPSSNASRPFHAFRWTSAGGMLDLGTLGGVRSIAYGINASGQIVGYAEVSPGVNHAFIWADDNANGAHDAGEMKDLNTLAPTAGWTYEESRAVNDRGQIIVTAINGSNQRRAFLLTPANAGPSPCGNPNPTPTPTPAPTPTPTPTPVPGTLQFSAAAYGVNEAAGPATITVTRTGGSDGAVSVGYATSNGTATAGSDYTAASGTLNFTQGELSKTFNVAVSDDGVDDPDLTVNLSLSAPTGGAALGAQNTAVLIITDDEATPAVSIADGSATEGNPGDSNSVPFAVTLSGPSAQTVTVNYATNSSYTASASDFTATSGTLTFNPGETAKTVNVPVTGDTIDEQNEYFHVALQSATNATVNPSAYTAPGTINDDDGPPALSINDVEVAEGDSGTVAATLTVTLLPASGQTVTVNYATVGNSAAISGTDFVSTSGTLTFAPGETSKTITVQVKGDTTPEPNEFFGVSLSGASNATISDSSGSIAINNDETTIKISNDRTNVEGNAGNMPFVFVIDLQYPSTKPVTFKYWTADGTAVAGSDFIGIPQTSTITLQPGSFGTSITVQVTGDTTFEANETFTLNISDVINATVTDGQGLGSITNDDTPPSFSVSDATVVEGHAGNVNAVFTVSLSAASGLPASVNYATADGTATSGPSGDYLAVSGTLNFAPGESSKTVSVAVNGDTIDEVNEAFTLNLSGATGATMNRAQGVGAITDDDGMPSLSVGDVSVIEGNSGTTVNATFNVSLLPASGQTVTVNYATANGTAVATNNGPPVVLGDYAATSGSLTFAPGETSKPVTVIVQGENLSEANETFTLNISGAINATVTDAQGQATITNDDPVPTVSLAGDVAVPEGNTGATTPATFTVNLSTASGQPVTVNYATTDGTAIAAQGDYVASSGTVTFAPGQTSQTFSIPVKGDRLFDPADYFVVTLSNATNANIAPGDGGRRYGTITDDEETSVVEFQSATYSVSEAGPSVRVTFVRTSGTAGNVRVAVHTENGTATYTTQNGINDYVSNNATYFFAEGETTKTFDVSIVQDTLDEADETFTVNFSSHLLFGATPGAKGTATVTINDDDAAPTFQCGAAAYSADENLAGGQLAISVTRTGGTNGGVSVKYATSDGTATAGSDYAARTGTLTFADGVSTQQFFIPITNDTLDETDETINLALSDPSSGTALGTQKTAVLTVRDDDGSPSLSAGDVTVIEGNTGTTDVTFNVSLSPVSGQTVTVNYATAPGTASAGSDYTSASGTLTFAPGETSKTVTVQVLGDGANEEDETFFVNLLNAAGATIADAQGLATILNDDRPALGFSQTVYPASEGAHFVTVTVTRSGDATLPASVDFATGDATATARKDYTAVSGTLRFAAGETSKTFDVLLTEDAFTEPLETIDLTLSNPTGGAALGPNDAAQVFISADDDPPPAGNPIDNSSDFVRQHYHDFLNREPDASGLAFWVNDIESCGADAGCREAKRINVSAAFFLSIEFQETGYYAYRAFKAAYGDATSPGVDGTVPVVRLQEFLPDTRRIGEGVVVGQAGWDLKLAENKSAYMQEFVARPRFTNAYPAALTPAQFVDALYANAGVTPSSAERQAA